MQLHPVIQRLSEMPSGELATQDVGFVLDVHRTVVATLITGGKLEAREINAKGRARTYYRVTAEAVLHYLVRTTTGDKILLLESIKAAFPRSSVLTQPKRARNAAAATPTPETTAAAPVATQMDLFAAPHGGRGEG